MGRAGSVVNGSGECWRRRGCGKDVRVSSVWPLELHKHGDAHAGGWKGEVSRALTPVARFCAEGDGEDFNKVKEQAVCLLAEIYADQKYPPRPSL